MFERAGKLNCCKDCQNLRADRTCAQGADGSLRMDDD
jgi:hypothetical protein